MRSDGGGGGIRTPGGPDTTAVFKFVYGAFGGDRKRTSRTQSSHPDRDSVRQRPGLTVVEGVRQGVNPARAWACYPVAISGRILMYRLQRTVVMRIAVNAFAPGAQTNANVSPEGITHGTRRLRHQSIWR
jgi:hypothetical protein